MSDMILLIDGTEYRLAGNVESVDSRSEVLSRLDKIDSRLDAIESGQKSQREELTSQRKDIQTLTTAMVQFDKTQEVLIHDVGHLQTSVYWGFALLGLFIAIVSWLRPRDSKPEPKPESHHVWTAAEVDELARLLEPRLRAKAE